MLWQKEPMIDKKLKAIFICLVSIIALNSSMNSAKAIDPPYQPQMERLVNILGALYFLQPLCEISRNNWLDEAKELIALEKATKDREQRLYGSFNEGYQSFARIYTNCTPAAKNIMMLYLSEGKTLSKYIHTKFAE